MCATHQVPNLLYACVWSSSKLKGQYLRISFFAAKLCLVEHLNMLLVPKSFPMAHWLPGCKMVPSLFLTLGFWGGKRANERKERGRTKARNFRSFPTTQGLEQTKLFPTQGAPCTLLAKPHACISFVTFGLQCHFTG